MKEEIEALERNNTWEVCDLPPGKTTIGCKWVYKTKYHENGVKQRDKARLVVLRNHQREGDHFTDTFAFVGKMVSVCFC